MLTDNDLKSYIKGYYENRKISYTKLDKHDRAIGVLLEENKRLNNIIDKAIEYLKYGVEPEEMEDYIYENLIEILKGG